MLLCVDTSLMSSVAVVDEAGVVLARRSSDTPRGHAEVIGDLIVGALTDAELTPRDITAVVTGMGPGPFTGLRIGIAAARAFAIACGVEEYPVVSHDAVALEAIERIRGPVAVVTDARRKEAAVTVYRRGVHGIPERTSGPVLHPQADGPAAIDTSVVGPEVTIVNALTIDAGVLGMVAARRRAAGIAPDVHEALYLRAPDAVPPAPRKRVLS